MAFWKLQLALMHVRNNIRCPEAQMAFALLPRIRTIILIAASGENESTFYTTKKN